MESTTIDTYNTALTEYVDPSTYSTDKHKTVVGTWTTTADELKAIFNSSDKIKTHYADSANNGFHVVDVIVDPTATQKKYNLNHDETNKNTIKNQDLEPDEVNQVYVFMERNWRDLTFVSNDNGQQKSSSKAVIEIN